MRDPLVSMLAAHAIQRALLMGCTCHADVTVREVADGTFVADVGHDPWCHLMRIAAAPSN